MLICDELAPDWEWLWRGFTLDIRSKSCKPAHRGTNQHAATACPSPNSFGKAATDTTRLVVAELVVVCSDWLPDFHRDDLPICHNDHGSCGWRD
jgi:hypothetical protein